MKVEPVTLTGKHVRLEPMSEAAIPALQKAAEDPAIWKWTWPGTDPDAVAAYVRLALDNQKKGIDLPFVTIDVASGEVAGSTRYMTIDTKNTRVEIGSTWLNPRYQRSPINTEAKYLMLTHAFETLGCIRVEFKTHHRNEQSQNALKRMHPASRALGQRAAGLCSAREVPPAGVQWWRPAREIAKERARAERGAWLACARVSGSAQTLVSPLKAHEYVVRALSFAGSKKGGQR